MGAISKILASQFRKARRRLGELRQQAAADVAQVPKDVKSVETLVRSGHDPLHAAYVAAQNFTFFFAEAVSQFPEFDPYCQIVGPAQDEYLPSTALPGKLPWIVRKFMNDAGKGSRMTPLLSSDGTLPVSQLQTLGGRGFAHLLTPLPPGFPG